MDENAIYLLPALTLVGGIVIVLFAMNHQAKKREMAHRERMALIERGLMPSPDQDPERFDALTQHRATGAGPSRSLSAGIVVIALGLGLMLIIGVAAEAPESGLGIGGAIVILGAAFVTNALVSRRLNG
jgi:hypothetical protein